MRETNLWRQFWNMVVAIGHAVTGWEQCDERSLCNGEIHYCQKRSGHFGKCKTCFGREFN